MATTSEISPGFIEDSLRNLATDCLDLVQLHCPPTDVYYRPEVFGALDRMVEAGKLRYYGVSVERVEEALKAIEYPNVQTVQIIFNCFRQRPAELFFEQAKRQAGGDSGAGAAGQRNVERQTDARFAIRGGRSPPVQSSRRGIRRGRDVLRRGLRNGLAAVEELRGLLPAGVSMAQFALRWILMHDAVSCAIPGGKRPSQVRENCAASDLPPLSEAAMAAVRGIYEGKIRDMVHQRW